MDVDTTSQLLEIHGFLVERFSDKSVRVSMGVGDKFWEDYLRNIEGIKANAANKEGGNEVI